MDSLAAYAVNLNRIYEESYMQTIIQLHTTLWAHIIPQNGLIYRRILYFYYIFKRKIEQETSG